MIRPTRHPLPTTHTRNPRAFTIIELMIALTVLSVLSVAVCFLTFGALNNYRYLRSADTIQSEVALATRRISNNLFEAQTGSIILGTSSLQTLTQPDLLNNFPSGVPVSYALAPDPNTPGQQMLTETDPRYGTNTLVHNVTSFSVTQVPNFTNLYQVDLTVAGPIPTERHFRISPRN